MDALNITEAANSQVVRTWQDLAQALASRARQLRDRWRRLGESGPSADARAQEAVCGKLADDLLRGDRHLARLLDGHTPGTDSITRFYETFLAAYDPGQRLRRGVFYTPQTVAGFVIRTVHECLQKNFGFPDGLAQTGPHADIRILDPAAGTGVFLVEVIDLIHQTLRDRWSSIGHDRRTITRRWREYVARHLTNRLTGYELLPAAAVLANVNVALKLRATGCPATGQHDWVRVGNSLELLAGQAPREATSVIIGNPPYAISSSNRHAALDALLADYKHGLKETNLNALSDDYVKFFRLAHALVVGAGAGAIGFVTNNSLLEGVTHRRMRALLLRDFDQLQIVDLHGSVMRRQEIPAGMSDESVFDIRQGVAITVLSRTPADSNADRRGRIRRADLWGTRQHKYDQLTAGPASLGWQEPSVRGPYFFFRTAGVHDEYQRWPSLAEIFGVYSSGIKFRKDGLLVKNHFSRDSAEEMLRDVAVLPAHALTAKYGFHETADWRLKDKRRLFANWRPEDIIPVTYRPFDVRYAFYPLDRANRIIVRGDSRVELMRHFLTVPNIGLIFNRQVVGDQVTHFLVSRHPVSHGTFYLGNKGQDYFAPLYLTDGAQLRSNLTSVLAGASPESVLHYLYAVVHSPAYRARYAEPLKVDFPRVPPPPGKKLFAALSRLGADLVGLHLLEDAYPAASWTQMGRRSPLVGPRPAFSGAQTPTVAHGYPKRRDDRVYLNPACWFDGVPEDAWNFRVGGYQVCAKWLKDRRGQTLTAADLKHYGRVVRALTQTVRLMSEIDQLIAAEGGWPTVFTGRQKMGPAGRGDIPR